MHKKKTSSVQRAAASAGDGIPTPDNIAAVLRILKYELGTKTRFTCDLDADDLGALAEFGAEPVHLSATVTHELGEYRGDQPTAAWSFVMLTAQYIRECAVVAGDSSSAEITAAMLETVDLLHRNFNSDDARHVNTVELVAFLMNDMPELWPANGAAEALEAACRLDDPMMPGDWFESAKAVVQGLVRRVDYEDRMHGDMYRAQVPRSFSERVMDLVNEMRAYDAETRARRAS